MRIGLSRVIVLVVASLALGGASGVAKESKKAKAPAAAKGAAPPGVTLNACGCYHKGNACVCTDKKAKCECADDCEPVGCEEKRQKELEHEIAAETKRAQDEDKKREAAEAEAARAQEKADEKAAEKVERGGDEAAAGSDDDSAGDPKPAEEKTTKPAHKGRDKK